MYYEQNIKQKGNHAKENKISGKKKIQKTAKKVKSETPKKMNYPDWTMPKHLKESDHKALKKFYELFSSGKLVQAFSFASNFDKVVREAIPSDILSEEQFILIKGNKSI